MAVWCLIRLCGNWGVILTSELIQRWGKVFPHWVPFLSFSLISRFLDWFYLGFYIFLFGYILVT
jgi:hypothetical protein